MIFGEYPCCGGDLALSMPDKSPAYMPEDCPHCRAKVWHRLSRVESASEKDRRREAATAADAVWLRQLLRPRSPMPCCRNG